MDFWIIPLLHLSKCYLFFLFWETTANNRDWACKEPQTPVLDLHRALLLILGLRPLILTTHSHHIQTHLGKPFFSKSSMIHCWNFSATSDYCSLWARGRWKYGSWVSQLQRTKSQSLGCSLSISMYVVLRIWHEHCNCLKSLVHPSR